MTPRPPRVPAPSEHAEQTRVVGWAANMTRFWPDLALLFAVPNDSGWLKPAQRAKLMREGKKSGVPDLVLPVPRSDYHGCFVEMKRTRGSRIAPEQKQWHHALRERGYFVAVCYGAEDAQSVLTQYLTLPPDPRPARGTA